jgi:hypothetical protein
MVKADHIQYYGLNLAQSAMRGSDRRIKQRVTNLKKYLVNDRRASAERILIVSGKEHQFRVKIQ